MSAHSVHTCTRVYFLYQKENMVNSMLSLQILDSYWLMNPVFLLVNSNHGLLLVVTPDGFCAPIGQFKSKTASYWLLYSLCSYWLI